MVRCRSAWALSLLCLTSGCSASAQQLVAHESDLQDEPGQIPGRPRGEDSCALAVEFKSSHTVAKAEMGIYRQTDIGTSGNGGKPIYSLVNGSSTVPSALGPFLFWHSAYRQWRIGYNYSDPDASVTQGGESDCPTGAKYWFDYRGGTWSDAQISVTEIDALALKASEVDEAKAGSKSGPDLRMTVIANSLVILGIAAAVVVLFSLKFKTGQVAPEDHDGKASVSLKISQAPLQAEGDA